MPSRTIELTDSQAQMIDRLVESGRYLDESEVIRESLALLLELHQSDDATRLAALRAAIQVGIDDMEAGRYRTFETPEALDQFIDELTERAIARHGAKK